MVAPKPPCMNRDWIQSSYNMRVYGKPLGDYARAVIAVVVECDIGGYARQVRDEAVGEEPTFALAKAAAERYLDEKAVD